MTSRAAGNSSLQAALGVFLVRNPLYPAGPRPPVNRELNRHLPFKRKQKRGAGSFYSDAAFLITD